MKKLIPIAAFLAIALASLAMAGFAYFAGEEAARIKFQSAADDALNRIESRVDLHLSLLKAAHAFFEARDGDVPRGAFQEFFNSLGVGQDYPGLRGVGYLKLVEHGATAEAEAEIERNYGIKREIYPASDLPIRTPVVLFEPIADNNLQVMGFDMYSDTQRRSAIDIAASSGQPSATELIQLGRAAGAEQTYPGFLVFKRLDVKTFATANGPAGQKTAGFLYAAFRGDDVFEAALNKAPALPVAVEIYDGATPQQHLLFSSKQTASPAYGDEFRVTRQVVVAGRSWTVVQRPTAAFTRPSSRGIPVVLGLFGLLLAGAVAAMARYQDRAYDAASQLQQTAEHNLVEKDLMLQEMKHRIKNSIARVLAIARQTATHAKDMGEFSSSFAARLQAMAASQDMLTRSSWQKADLRQLLEIELGQVFGKELPDSMLTGDEVLLGERATQALGLTFHELATNALKYGRVSDAMQSLTVRWRMTKTGRQPLLELEWRETGNKATPPTSTGFGTKLIDMNITRELNGAISRDYGSDGLRISIGIPMVDM